LPSQKGTTILCIVGIYASSGRQMIISRILVADDSPSVNEELTAMISELRRIVRDRYE
jgi:hypothetical protein